VPVSRALRRLLRVRQLEEDQRRAALESAIGDLHRLEEALACNQQRERLGRELVSASCRTGKLVDRIAGIVESYIALRQASLLENKIVNASESVSEMREVYLSTRVDRRQAETVIEETESRDELEAARHSQQDMDDWHRTRRQRRIT
jgi:hypothetical protein